MNPPLVQRTLDDVAGREIVEAAAAAVGCRGGRGGVSSHGRGLHGDPGESGKSLKNEMKPGRFVNHAFS